MPQKKATRLASLIRKYMVIRDISDIKTAARLMVFNYDTLRRRLKNPETFTMDELLRIVKYLKIPTSEIEFILEV